MTDLFGYQKPRKKPRVMMHAIDHGQAPGMMPDWQTSKGAHFKCARCGHDDGWSFNMQDSEVRRGLPCPVCNAALITPADTTKAVNDWGY